MPVHGTGNGTENGPEGKTGAGNVSGMLAGSWKDGGTEAVWWAGYCFVDEGGAGNMNTFDCVGVVVGRRDYLRQPWSTDWGGLAQVEEGSTVGGVAGEEGRRKEEEEGGRRCEEKGKSW